MLLENGVKQKIYPLQKKKLILTLKNNGFLYNSLGRVRIPLRVLNSHIPIGRGHWPKPNVLRVRISLRVLKTYTAIILYSIIWVRVPFFAPVNCENSRIGICNYKRCLDMEDWCSRCAQKTENLLDLVRL